MSTYPSNDPVPSTPIFDQTITSTAVQVDGGHTDADGAGGRADQAKDTAKQAAGRAADTAKETAGQVEEQAQHVGAAAADAGKQVGATAKDQASRVASDAVGQARELYGQATEQLSSQAGTQQKNAAATLHTFRDDLQKMHEEGADGGLAAEAVQAVSKQAGRVADWLDDREPGQVLDEVKRFAAQRPGLFIGLAAVTGIVAARAVKALGQNTKDEAERTADASRAETARASRTTPAAPAPTAYGIPVDATDPVLGSVPAADRLR